MTLLDRARFMGSGLRADVRQAVMAASLSGSTGQVTQLDMTISDDGFDLLESGVFTIGSRITVDDFRLEISNIETGDEDRSGVLEIKCRPIIVRKLKNRRGSKVMKNVSPTDFIREECKAVGAKYILQDSPRRKQVARDVPKKGQYEISEPESSWTTFKRLANELGYIVFESAGTVYFGKPTWLMSRGNLPTINANYRTGKANTRVVTVPSCRRSADDPITTASFSMLTNDASFVRPGKRVNLKGIPTFNGVYLLEGFDLDLLSPVNEVGVDCVTPLNPEPQPPQTGKDTPRTRLGTRLAIDFLYWIKKQSGDKYVVGARVSTNISDPNIFDGAELARWAAARVGAYLPTGANNQIQYCDNHGTIISIQSALRRQGALLWSNNRIDISMGNGNVIGQVDGRVGVIKNANQSRYRSAGTVPGIV